MNVRLAWAVLAVIKRLKKKKHTADYILGVVCDMLKSYGK